MPSHPFARRGLGAVAVLVALGALAGCGSSGHTRTGANASANVAPADPLPSGELTVYSSLALQGPSTATDTSVADAELLALEAAGGRVAGHRIRLVVLDNATAALGGPDPSTAIQNAKTATADPSTIAYLGDDTSTATAASLPYLNGAGILAVSPSATANALTLGGTGDYTLSRLYPAGTRTFARVVPDDASEASAAAQYLSQEGCRDVFVISDGGLYGQDLSRGVTRALPGLNLASVGSTKVPAAGTAGLAEAAARVGRTGANCVFYGGDLDPNTVTLWRDLAQVNPNLKLFGADALATAGFTTVLPTSEQTRTFLTSPGLAPNAYSDLGQRFFEAYQARFGGFPDPLAIFGYESMAALLDAIKSSAPDITRAGVIHQFFAIRNRNSVIGTYSIDANGDSTLGVYGAYVIDRGALVFSHALNTST